MIWSIMVFKTFSNCKPSILKITLFYLLLLLILFSWLLLSSIISFSQIDITHIKFASAVTYIVANITFSFILSNKISNRKAQIIINSFLLMIFIIGIWFLQPKVNSYLKLNFNDN